jgi:erythronate-4-phosphate dehydrogenase
MKILADASLPNLLDCFPRPFEITLYHHNDEVSERLSNQDILLCRSTLKINPTLLNRHAPRVVATASSGIDHVDETLVQSGRIQLLDAKGSNAASVADYVLACLAFMQKNHGFCGATAGIIGLGAVGTVVAKRLKTMNFDVLCYDPPKSLASPNFAGRSLEDILACDLICIHASLHDRAPFPSRQLIGEKQLALIRENTLIINASRGNIVSESAVLQSKTPFFYCTDVYASEPVIRDALVDFATLCTPHIAGHSVEAKETAIRVLSQKLHQYYGLPMPEDLTPSFQPRLKQATGRLGRIGFYRFIILCTKRMH